MRIRTLTERWAQIHQEVFDKKIQIRNQMYLNKIQNTALKKEFN